MSTLREVIVVSDSDDDHRANAQKQLEMNANLEEIVDPYASNSNTTSHNVSNQNINHNGTMDEHHALINVRRKRRRPPDAEETMDATKQPKQPPKKKQKPSPKKRIKRKAKRKGKAKGKRKQDPKNDPNGLFTAEKILGWRYVNGTSLFKVKWQHFDEVTWEPIPNVANNHIFQHFVKQIQTHLIRDDQAGLIDTLRHDSTCVKHTLLQKERFGDKVDQLALKELFKIQ
eukprot:648331_1